MKEKTEKGEATNRVSHALANMAPLRPTRTELLESQELLSEHRKSSNDETLEEFKPSENLAASKTIGRLVKSGHLKEVLVPVYIIISP